jgi:outer membrane protein assembly factor BamB
MKTSSLLRMAFGIALAAEVAGAADWPQWRGPQRDGNSGETGLLQEWPVDGPKLLWQVKDLGFGYSTPAVSEGCLYLLSNEGLDNERVLARAAEDGRELWAIRIGKVGNPDQKPSYPGARSTPTVDGDAIYALGSDGDLVCLDRATREIRWQKNLRTEFGGRPGEWAYSESPLIDGDVLVCTPGGPDATLVAMDKQTGAVIWKCPVPGGDEAAYASAIVVTTNGTRQYVQFLQKGLVGVDAETGEFLWRYDKTAEGSPANIPSPVASDDLVYSGARRSGGGLVKLTAGRGTIEAEEVYFSVGLPKSMGGAVQVGDYLYGFSGETLMCIEFRTGNVKWEERSIGDSSVCYADGCLYLHGMNGDVALIEATPEGYREKGRFSPSDPPDRGTSKAWAYPVVANGRLYLRDLDSLWCYNIKADE